MASSNFKYALVLFDWDGCTAVVEAKKLKPKTDVAISAHLHTRWFGKDHKVEVLELSDSKDELNLFEDQWSKSHRSEALDRVKQRRNIDDNGGYLSVWPDDEVDQSTDDQETVDPPTEPEPTEPLLIIADTLKSGEFEDVFTRKSNSCRLPVFDNQVLPRHTKRHLDYDQEEEMAPTDKRRKLYDVIDQSSDCPSPMSTIIQAVDRLSTSLDLVADGSRVNTLPTVTGKHNDLKAISPETMADLLAGSYDNKVDNVKIIDCRYPYEYDGGHIKGAVNLYKKDAIQKFVKETRVIPGHNHVIIFHCEFSTERGPKMYRYLRSLDRELNKDSYPRLNFPEVYLLEGGYEAFHENEKHLCHPQSYKPMLHKEHSDDLRHFRVKSKSWAAGDKPRHKTRASGMGVKLSF